MFKINLVLLFLFLILLSPIIISGIHASQSSEPSKTTTTQISSSSTSKSSSSSLQSSKPEIVLKAVENTPAPAVSSQKSSEIKSSSSSSQSKSSESISSQTKVVEKQEEQKQEIKTESSSSEISSSSVSSSSISTSSSITVESSKTKTEDNLDQPKEIVKNLDYSEMIKIKCEEFGCNSTQVIGIMKCESGGNKLARNGIYTGLFQFAPATFRSYSKPQYANLPNADIYNPEDQIYVATWMIANGYASQWTC
jgi:Transglycosylase SLT domain